MAQEIALHPDREDGRYAYDPTVAESNTRLLNAALKEGGTVTLTRPGTYLVTALPVVPLTVSFVLGSGVVVTDGAKSFGGPMTLGAQTNIRRRPRVALIGDSLVGDMVTYSSAADGGRWRGSQAITAGHVRWPEYGVDATRDVFQGTAGTTGIVPPVWPANVGGTVQDGTVTWTRIASTAEIARPMSWWEFASAMLGQRVDTAMINGVGGCSVEDCILRLPVVLATNPDYVLIQAGTNNCSGTKGASDGAGIWAAYKSLVDQVLAAGKVAIVSTMFPSANYDTAAKRKAWRYVNDQIRQYARTTQNVLLVELADVYVNETNGYLPAKTRLDGTTVWYTDSSGDGVHPVGPGHLLLGKRVFEALDKFLPFCDVFGAGPDSDYNMVVNPSMHGTGGSHGVNSSGSVATGWVSTGFTASTCTVTASKVARTDGIRGFWQRERYQASAAAAATDNLDLSLTPNVTPASPWAVGDTLEGFVEIGPATFGASFAGLMYLSVIARCVGATGQFHYLNTLTSGEAAITQSMLSLAGDSGFVMPRMVLRVPPFRVLPSATGINLLIKGFASGAADFTLDVGRTMVRPIVRNP